MKRSKMIIALLTGLAVIVSCKQETKKQAATTDKIVQQSIKNWMESRKDEYPNYVPISFGELTPRYRFNSRTHSIEIALNNESSKKSPNQSAIDSLKRLLNEKSSDFLGYTITHNFTVKGIDGEVKKDEKLFFIDPQNHVITVLNSDAWDLIMDKELFFRPEIPDSVK